LFSAANPRHYHCGPFGKLLVGHIRNPAWFGDACPPECPGPLEGETMQPMEDFFRRGDAA
jgi:hypothetical protein